MSESSRPHGLQPTRLLHPWDFPGKSTGVGCHCLLHKQSNHDVKTIKIPVTIVVRMPITIYCQPLLHQVLPKSLCIPISLILEENNSHPRPNRWINENEKEFTQGPKLICYLNNWNSPHMKNTDSFHQQFLNTYYIQHPSLSTGFPGGTPASAAFEALISGSRRSLGIGNATHSSILAWKIPWTEEGRLAGFSPWGHKHSDMTEQLLIYIYNINLYLYKYININI